MCMFQLTFIYSMNAFLRVRMGSMTAYINIHISMCPHMCEMNIEEICSCALVYMQNLVGKAIIKIKLYFSHL